MRSKMDVNQMDGKLNTDSLACTGCSTIALPTTRILWQQLDEARPCLGFASTGGLRMSSVSERGLLLWLHVKHYIEMLGRGELPKPKGKSFVEAKIRSADPLFTVKVGIFTSIAREIKPFLIMYQADQPKLPFFSCCPLHFRFRF